MKPLRIGTRGSALARWQANHLRDALAKSFGVESETVVVKTSGDRFAAAQIEQIGIRGIFTKELEDALIDGRADLAVHSMKDVPTEFSPVCKVAVVFPREDPRDALVSQHGESLNKLPQGARIGTSSLRRASQLRQFRSDFQIVEVRGNVDTRLRKVASGEVEANGPRESGTRPVECIRPHRRNSPPGNYAACCGSRRARTGIPRIARGRILLRAETG